MESVKTRLQAKSMEEFQRNRKLNQKIKAASLIFLAVFTMYVAGIETSLVILQKDEIDTPVVNIAGKVFRVLKFCLDLILYTFFVKDLLFFFKLKKEKTERVTKFNKFILVWAFFLMVFSFMHSFIAILVGFVNISQKFIRTVDRSIIPLKDFLISTTMMYLFYY